jgi:hypothetical protein
MIDKNVDTIKQGIEITSSRLSDLKIPDSTKHMFLDLKKSKKGRKRKIEIYPDGTWRFKTWRFKLRREK